ncbi:alpha/beta fold hydrolase [Noviherbaspirillum galbum]|uniref:Alpha/beta hydrolase n=1 Tax=Noviherbaspirillum galbum TaxID=2709383 RepID=A0A6B3STC6_9BURK|nr:alpha/beta hydrolase [Noviherbaspirillum galbum]NEX63748.1 alpha/beta hydrolase [Noviherbaspirillum galbum]
MFAHGFGCNQTVWRDIAPAFEQTREVVLFDQVGATLSNCSYFDPHEYNSLERYADDVIEIIDALDLPPVNFVGHSVAAMIGLIAAVRAPYLFSSLVLVAPSPCYVNDEHYLGGFSRAEINDMLAALDDNYPLWAQSIASTIMANPDRPLLRKNLASSFCETDPDVARHFARLTFLSDSRSYLPLVSTPTLVMQCRNDVVAPESVGRYLCAMIPGVKHVLLDATGHCPHLSAPAEVVGALTDFLKGEP